MLGLVAGINLQSCLFHLLYGVPLNPSGMLPADTPAALKSAKSIRVRGEGVLFCTHMSVSQVFVFPSLSWKSGGLISFGKQPPLRCAPHASGMPRAV